MPDVVEIYICKAGQKLEDGQMVVSHDITDKKAAKADAENRCKLVPSIARVAYYAIDASGGFQPYYAYANPKVEAVKPKPVMSSKKRKKKKATTKKGLWKTVKTKLGI